MMYYFPCVYSSNNINAVWILVLEQIYFGQDQDIGWVRQSIKELYRLREKLQEEHILLQAGRTQHPSCQFVADFSAVIPRAGECSFFLVSALGEKTPPAFPLCSCLLQVLALTALEILRNSRIPPPPITPTPTPWSQWFGQLWIDLSCFKSFSPTKLALSGQGLGGGGDCQSSVESSCYNFHVLHCVTRKKMLILTILLAWYVTWGFVAMATGSWDQWNLMFWLSPLSHQ